MKHFLFSLLTLSLAALLLFSAFAAEIGEYIWREFTLEVTDIQDAGVPFMGGELTPSDMTEDEYCVSLYLTVDEALWSDAELRDAMYAETYLEAENGERFYPGCLMTGSEEPTFIYSFCVSKEAPYESLKLFFGEPAEEDFEDPNLL